MTSPLLSQPQGADYPEPEATSSDLDSRPPLTPARLLRSDGEALEAARAVARQALAGAAQRDRLRQLPWDEVDLFSASGLGGIGIPRAYGGPGLSFVTVAEVFRLVSAADPSVGQIPQNQFGILGLLEGSGSRAQKERFYTAVLRGERIANSGPERGTRHTLDVQARIVRDGDGYRLSGEKFYSTGALFAHWITAKAIDDKGRLVMALIPRGAPGLRILNDWSGFGQRTTASGTVLLDRVPVAAENLVDVWRLAEKPNIQGAASQLIQAAIDAGIARAALDDAIAFVRQRARPWIDANVERAADDPYVIADIGRLQIDLHAAEALLRRAGRVLDQVNAAPVDAESAARASIAVAEAKVLAGEKLLELAGSRATLAEFNLDRHWRNARTHTLHDPVRWKYHAIGNYHLNGAKPARHSWI
ncbi:sulfur acquisition oxidoreductase, SfnB family [Azotobacter beijerinckii]|uniref:Sulfur acquisition oxidoreductase, SfnB family n=1 Tax=Azotobacter beijerinckii TaxID=170623 RepID=A0A1H9PLB7_9GAMM|nr:SfnB family sulfur acquisition oxidoreductase [Azotobacter beijerinckii]SER49041.1 sulfur acquisition oxidoreductase, SfnB family [Azotobacter beijerinckii]